jgi:ABC-2 type transport system ATP-binding protein
MLQLTNIQKSFGSHHVFSIDELRLQNGIYWLKGANGSGKSTLMNVVAGLLPFKGEIILNEKISIHKQRQITACWSIIPQLNPFIRLF